MGSIFQSPRAIGATSIPYYTPVNNPGAAVDPGPKTPTLFQPLQIRDVTLKNRIIVAPMCMFSSEGEPSSPNVGALTDFHIAHLGHLATKGVGIVMIEATAVQPNGWRSPNDSGLWQEGTDPGQFKALRRVVDMRGIPIKADESVGGWPDDMVAPTGGEEFKWAPGQTQYWAPRDLSIGEIQDLVTSFARSARTDVAAGVDIIEVHGAHGYLLHVFLSPVTNRREDRYGGSFENQVRIVREVTTAIRAAIPNDVPLFLRISGTEWLDGTSCAANTGSWDLASSIQLAMLLPEFGVDLVDVSSGGNHREQSIQHHGNYQVDLAGEIRQTIRAAGQNTLVGAVGLIRDPEAARDIVQGADQEFPGMDAGALMFCPPKLGILAAVWVAYSLTGVILIL
ncbi:hypothetical protein BDV27DRAFT_146288 [Aspergillus caelatus]|uniref:NADH:flavin oxidoreductase/NADH oxidase N-terminal domain-containing protein n=1 Tax=Aspergillus caelatus TaxID=61420 RepID=A0A5N7A405_9EURO|nr:uncharacterized protein BDV27DRAFT_146288 [Aspergillus caelatus]KAE8363240.1 hypothetical protein BDV27DRAFT_146288 [Aspergillus caelatus]